MNKVKDFLNWQKIIFPDRTIIKSDLRFMSWEQVRNLNNTEIRSYEQTENGEIILFV